MTSQSAATLRSRYVEQAASDLEENRRRQQELTEQLKVLKREEALLVDILSLTERFKGLADAPPLPEQAQGEPAFASAGAASSHRGRNRRAAAARSGGTAAKAGGQAKQRRPLLGDLLTELLGAYDEPRLAKELRDELMERSPDRAPTPQVVRNTLEALVAKGRVRRHKQERSVLYTVVRSAQE